MLRAEPRASPVPERAVWLVPVTQQTRKENAQCTMQIEKCKLSKLRNESICHLAISPSAISALPLLLYPAAASGRSWLRCARRAAADCVAGGRRERIVECVGPERIETLWWRGPSVRRDYYRVTTESGRYLWIFQRLADRTVVFAWRI